MTRAWSRGRITGTSKGLQLLRYPRSKPICATGPVSEHGQPHMRSPLVARNPAPLLPFPAKSITSLAAFRWAPQRSRDSSRTTSYCCKQIQIQRLLSYDKEERREECDKKNAC